MSRKSALFACLLAAWWGGCWLAADVWFERRADTAFQAKATRAERFVAVAILGGGGTALGLLALTMRARRREIAAQKETETRLRQSHDLLRAIAARHDEQHEAERRRLAHKLHEDLAQNISSLRLYFAALDDDARRADALAAMQGMIDRALAIAREMVTALRPTVLDLGIAATLRWLAADFEKGLGLRFELEIAEDIELDDESATFIFRAAQEILVNVALHAAAHIVRLSFAADSDACRLTIRDDGRGFDPTAPRADNAFGLLRLAEQAERHGGTLRIDAAPGRGTAVEIGLPA